MKTLSALFVILIATMGLYACGGGGVGTTATPTPAGTVVNLSSFKSVFMGVSAGAQYSFSLTGTDLQGNAWSGLYTVVADGTTSFDGQNVTKSDALLTLRKNSGTPITSSTTQYLR